MKDERITVNQLFTKQESFIQPRFLSEFFKALTPLKSCVHFDSSQMILRVSATLVFD